MADIDEMLTTERRDGVYAGCMQFIRQIAIGAGLFVTNATLEAMGFVRGSTVQSPSFGESLRSFMLVAPALVICLAIMVSFAFNLTAKRHKIILDEIKQRRQGGAPDDVHPDVRRLCEQLTGLPYQELWQRVGPLQPDVLSQAS
jgi:oligogalacturonide transporter